MKMKSNITVIAKAERRKAIYTFKFLLFANVKKTFSFSVNKTTKVSFYKMCEYKK